LNNEPPGLSVKLDFLRQLRLVQQNFRDADATRIADAHDTSLGCHVITL